MTLTLALLDANAPRLPGGWPLQALLALCIYLGFWWLTYRWARSFYTPGRRSDRHDL